MISIKNSKLLMAVIFCAAFSLQSSAQTFVGKNMKLTIFSSTPIEDIRAASNSVSGVLISKTQELAVQIPIKSLDFEKKLMQEHFNENYMESDKFPMAKFKGIISPVIDFTKDGTYAVSVKGVLNVHGIEQARTISGNINIKNGSVGIASSFDVATANHKIEIPKLVFAKIAEIIKINITGTLTLLK
jgi:polyisoprenoid-binding protein YceI